MIAGSGEKSLQSMELWPGGMENITEELICGGWNDRIFMRFKESDQLINQLLIPTIEGKFSVIFKGRDVTSTMLIEHASL